MRSKGASLAVAFAAAWALMLAPAAAAFAALWSRLGDPGRDALGAILRDGASYLALVALGTAVLAWLVARWFVARHVAPALELAQSVRILATANPSHRVEPSGSAELSALAGAINAFADERQMLLRDVEARIADANLRVEEERNRLAALVSDLAQGVLVCNRDGRILLYNERARALLEPGPGPRSEAAPAATPVGLGRSVFAFFDRGLVTHALESVVARAQKGDGRAVASYVTRVPDGRLVRLQVAPVRGTEGTTGEDRLGGFVLLFDDVTRAVEVGSRTGVALEQLVDASRRALGSMRAAIETLLSFPEMAPDKRAQFMAVIQQEAASLTSALERTAAENAPSWDWLLEDIGGEDLASALADRIERELGVSARAGPLATGVWLKVDSYALGQAITGVARRIRDELGGRDLRLSLAPSGRHAHLDIRWSGRPLPPDAVSRWESERAGGDALAVTLKEVVSRHGGELWYQRDESQEGFLRLLLPRTVAGAPAWRPASRVSGRPEYYDFDLFHQAGQSAELDERKLSDLTYTVFDTETTGLSPSEGDEIVCIGAVRIVNGRLLRQECYEQFVDPRRPISLESIRVTGIAPEMLAGQPTIERVLPEFHRFCEDTVLVAHNAAFDLRFLQLKESKAGVRFTHPVLDTLLLAAAAQPEGGAFQLEAMAERFGVPVIGRHTALGDAIMTGEIFLRLIPLLATRGIVTLRDAREASERTYHARIRY